MHWLRVIRSHWHFMTSFTIDDSAHRKLTAGNPDHTFLRFAWRASLIRNCGDEIASATECWKLR
jgi:hypothetical protein